jgi:hypothetical protein
MLSGKYMNGYHQYGNKEGNYATYVPPGWTDWYY